MSTSPEPTTDLSPPPYAKEDPAPDNAPKEEPTTDQPCQTPPVIIQEKPHFPPPAYTEKPVIIDDVSETRSLEDNSRLDSVVSPLLWLAVILSILLFSPCGYIAFAFTCFAFWTETGGNIQAARYLSSVARICAFASFMMGVIILLSPSMSGEDTQPYCLFEDESYRICI
ncbi:hypothetical protein LOD99_12981 [Oopsacas minuta]|uniref:Transmembrane protein n=1 Tax=Oopsacas minuta TaxID=111878 RepID=A0AAV7J8H2_9METZ|nr:hypothetical protein LOD99_12981 [Oopsacas minuta]